MKFASPKDAAACDAFFAASPPAQTFFAALVKLVESLDHDGKVQLTATSSHVAFKGRAKFLWAHGAPRDGLWIGFIVDAPFLSPRLRVHARGKRFSIHTKITALPLDAELKRWVRTAYDDDVARSRKAQPAPPPKKRAAKRH